MCHNLGAANTSANPFSPSWEIIGGYWQWGRKSMLAPGPSGPSAIEANSGSYPVQPHAMDDSWSDEGKTGKDPCPTGYRVPTESELDGLPRYNEYRTVGTWDNNPLNYSSGSFFGDELFLPAAGGRRNRSGVLVGRGNYGVYWSSTESNSRDAWHLFLNGGSAFTYNYDYYYIYSPYYRNGGFSVRCIAE